MTDIIVKTKTKKQEKTVKAFLESQDIDYSSVAQEDAAVYAPKRAVKRKKNSRAKERLIAEIKEAVRFINLVKEGKRKARPAKELLNEL